MKVKFKYGIAAYSRKNPVDGLIYCYYSKTGECIARKPSKSNPLRLPIEYKGSSLSCSKMYPAAKLLLSKVIPTSPSWYEVRMKLDSSRIQLGMSKVIPDLSYGSGSL